MKKAVRIRCYGQVQGVFFRVSAQKEAVQLGICGWVQNESDGSVQILAEGTDDQIESFRLWCQRGPNNAQVSKLEVVDVPYKGTCDSFIIKRF